jgi:hypothetical protein
MNGPTSNAKEKSLLSRQDWFQRLIEIGGVIVFLGLLIEDGPELWEALLRHRLPSRGVIGGIIVAIGVGVEVLFASLVTHTSKRLQELADARNAEFHERAAEAERRTVELEAEVERLRKENNDISTLLADRAIKDLGGFMDAMRAFSGIGVLVIATDSSESKILVATLTGSLRVLPEGVAILVTENDWNNNTLCRKGAIALGDWLNDSGVVPWLRLRDESEATSGNLIVIVGPKPQNVERMKALRDGWAQTMKEVRDEQI